MKISFFKNEWTTYCPAEMMIDLDWNEIADILTTFIKVPVKEQTQMYNLWEFKVTDGEIHRCKDDCIALHGLVLDYDNNLTLNDALLQFDGYECVFYTTFNHSTKKDKFRVVLPFTKPMSIEQFALKKQAMIDAFPGVDRASFSRSQAIFLHSGPDESLAFSCRFNGVVLDPDIFIDEVAEPIVYKTQTDDKSLQTPGFRSAYKAAIISSLMTCRGVRYLHSLSLVIILKSCGGTFEEYQSIVRIAGAADSCIQDIKSQTESWAAVSNDALIGKIKRDKFINQFGGIPVNIQTNSKKKQKINKIVTIVR